MREDSGSASLRRILPRFANATLGHSAFGLVALRLALLGYVHSRGDFGACSLTALQTGRFGVVADTEGTPKQALVSERPL